MKTKKIPLLILLVVIFALSAHSQDYKSHNVDAPFEMPTIYEYIFPSAEFNIVDFGASAGMLCTKAINDAIDACNNAGDGKVVIPKGEWLTGAIRLKSNVCIYLQDGAVLSFTDNPSDYLPPVPTIFETLTLHHKTTNPES